MLMTSYMADYEVKIYVSYKKVSLESKLSVSKVVCFYTFNQRVAKGRG